MSLVHVSHVRSPADLEAAEGVIARVETGAAQGRCAFLRSEAYQRLRLAALYRLPEAPLEVCGESARVVLMPSGELDVFLLARAEFADLWDDDPQLQAFVANRALGS